MVVMLMSTTWHIAFIQWSRIQSKLFISSGCCVGGHPDYIERHSPRCFHKYVLLIRINNICSLFAMYDLKTLYLTIKRCDNHILLETP